jgi:hypothetical protein
MKQLISQSSAIDFLVRGKFGDSANSDHDPTCLNPHRIRNEIHAHRRRLRLAGRKIEAAVVLRAFNDVIHHKSAGEVDLFMRAKAVSGVILVIGTSINGERPLTVVKANHVFQLDVTNPAGFHPHSVHFLVHKTLAKTQSGSAARA